MRKELVEYAKTVCMDTPLDEIQKHVRDMDEFRYVFSMAQKNEDKTTEVFPFSKEITVSKEDKILEDSSFNKEVLVSGEIFQVAKEKFKDADLDVLKTSTVQKALKCGYLLAWRIKNLLKNEKNIKKDN